MHTSSKDGSIMTLRSFASKAVSKQSYQASALHWYDVNDIVEPSVHLLNDNASSLANQIFSAIATTVL